MKETKTMDNALSKYSKGEEIFNMVSHIVGGALGLAGVILCIIFAAIHKNVYGIVSCGVYGLTLVLLYTFSSIYHGLRPGGTAKKVFQILDHCTIFLLIAGTYTPFALCTLREYDVATGWTIFGVIWGITVIGITLTAIDLRKYRKLSMVCYILMGWCIMVKGNVMPELLTTTGFLLLLTGGIAYTIGAIFYVVGKKRKWMHSIFHIACVIGSMLQLLCILFYVV